jgi:DNA processing protein
MPADDVVPDGVVPDGVVPDGVLHPGDTAWVVALAALDPFPRQLVELVFRHGAEQAWRRILDANPGIEVPVAVATRWARRAAAIDPPALLDAHRLAGVGVSVLGGAGYPLALLDDPEAPIVVFHRGEPGRLNAPRVGIVGTRQATSYGRALALEWGEALSAAGVVVVSGLALGIDAAAHEGALRGPTAPVAIVGSGLDIVYPRRNRALWHEVGARGLLYSEHPLGVPAAAAHFPARNRIIAGLSDVVLVVESHKAGGSLITAGAALERHRTVLAIPGSVHSPASEGTNLLLRDGATVAVEVADVLGAIELSPGSRRRRPDARVPPDPAGRALLEAFGWSPARLEMLALRTGASMLQLADQLERLVAAGWVHESHGWFERIAEPTSRTVRP